MDGRLGGDFIDTYAAMVLPLLLIGVALGLIATLGQTKGMFSMEKIVKPDLQKFNVFMGIKRIFLSVDSLIELGMSMLKVDLSCHCRRLDSLGIPPQILLE